MSFVSRLAACAGELSPAEVRVAAFLAEHPHSVGHLSAARLADAARTSDATVIRTVRKLGYGTLAALRESLASELSLSGRLDATVSGAAKRGSATQRLVEERIAAVGTLPSRVDEQTLRQATDVLAPAKRVCVVGFGPAAHLAGYAAHQLGRVGVAARAMTTTGRGFADELAQLEAGDAVVVLAYDGVTAEVAVLLEHAVALEVPAVQLTADLLGADPRAAVVLCAGRGDPMHSPTHVATVVLLEVLVLALAARRARRAEQAGRRLERLRRQLSAAART
jgi:DNA-binding MurR/RpiR family transcriptional regulator